VLRYLQDLSVEQTAATMRCSVGTVKSQTARGLDALRGAYPRYPEHAQPGLSGAAIPPVTAVRPALVDALNEVLPGDTVTVTFSSWLHDYQRTGTPLAEVVVRIDDHGRVGQITLEVRSYSGTALANADFEAGANTLCEPSQRRTGPDGSILQLDPPHRPARETGDQEAWAYTSGGHEYAFTVDGGDGSGSPTEAQLTDRWLPLTSAQLGQVAERMAAVG
jgi:hypothetical protein